MNPKLQLAFFIFTLLAIIIGAIWIVITEKRIKRFFLGKKAKDLEDTIILLERNIARLNSENKEMQRSMSVVDAKLKKSIRGLETVRFNPFNDQGSNQSFAIGMLNEEGDGVVFSSLYSRERMSVFAKPIKNNKSEYELTAEEKEVLQNAVVR